MDKISEFEAAQKEIRTLDFQGNSIRSEVAFRQFQRRNSFGLDRNKRIHRIFQSEYLQNDIAGGFLTLPKASSSVWGDVLENPLSDVYDIDIATGLDIHLGSLVNSFHALCWTHRADSNPDDWADFSHGKDSVRISTTAGKIMDRVMRVEDPAFMYRAWLVEVEYKTPSLIKQMQNPAEVYRRMECQQGALLALSAAVVRTTCTDEDEVRLLFDPSVVPTFSGLPTENPNLLRIPFDWTGFIDREEPNPYLAGA